MLSALISLWAMRKVAKQAVQQVDFEEVLRNTAAYGWEVAMSGDITSLPQTIETIHAANPFLNPNWRANVVPVDGA